MAGRASDNAATTVVAAPGLDTALEEAASIDGRHIYQARPHELAVVGMRITAQCSTSQADDAAPAAGPAGIASWADSSSDHNIVATNAGGTSGQQQPLQQRSNSVLPPSSFKDPFASRDANSGGSSPRQRPRSVELSARAFDAMADLGRAARGSFYGFRNRTRSDSLNYEQSIRAEKGQQARSQAVPHLVFSPSMQDTNDLIPDVVTESNTSMQPLVQQQSGSETLTTEDAPSVLKARRVYRMRPIEGHEPSRIQPIKVAAWTEVQNADVPADDLSAHLAAASNPVWRIVDKELAEFVSDNEKPAALQQGGAAGRAGTFRSASQGGSEGSTGSMVVIGHYGGNASAEGQHSHESSEDSTESPMPIVRPPPLNLLSASREASPSSARTKIMLKLRFKINDIGNVQPLQASPHAALPSSPRLAPAGPRSPQPAAQSAQQASIDTDRHAFTRSPLIFVSSDSRAKLLNAINNTQVWQGRFLGPLASYESARLEGIEWISFTPPTSQTPTHALKQSVFDFEWGWKNASVEQQTFTRSSARSEAQHVKCACAFARFDEAAGRMELLAFLQFMIEVSMPSKKDAVGLGVTLPKQQQQRIVSFGTEGNRVSFGVAGAASNLGGQRLVCADNSSATKNPVPLSSTRDTMQFPASISSGDGANTEQSEAPRARRSSTGRANDASVKSWGVQHSPNADVKDGGHLPREGSTFAKAIEVFRRRVQSTPSAHAPSQEVTQLKANHVELRMEDVELDSPVFRAVLHTLERRTITIKRASKALVKAAAEVVASIDGIQEADKQLDMALNEMSSWAPATFQSLTSEHLVHKRADICRQREQESRLIVVHILAPMSSLRDLCRDVQEQVKVFENESKTYYASMQKWLSSRGQSSNVGANGPNDLYSPDAIGFDRSTLKQEREDDKQKLRQARFDLARYELFRAIVSLHGGEAEIGVASHLLALVRWHAATRGTNDVDSNAAVRAFELSAHAEAARVQAETATISQRCMDLEVKIAELKQLLNQAAAVGGETEMIGQDSDGPVNNRYSVARVMGTKQRIKSLISSFTSGAAGSAPSHHRREHSQLSIPISASPNMVNRNEEKATEQEYLYAPHANDADASLKWESETLSPHEMATPDLDSFAEQAEPKHSDRPSSAAVNGYDRWRQSLSNFGSTPVGSPSKKTFFTDMVHRLPAPAALTRQLSGKRHTSDDQNALSTDLASQRQNSPNVPTATHLQSSQYPAQRKKEGILWVMSKSISGVSESDTPRGALRAHNWRESWVVLSGSGHLGEYAHWKDPKAMTLEPSQPLIDLRFATVREARGLDRRFAFEVVTRDSRRFFQAPNEDEMRGWIGAIRYAIECLLNGTSSVRQIDKVARSSALDVSDPDGIGIFDARQVFDGALPGSPLNAQRHFGQSLTDLGVYVGVNGRLFQRTPSTDGNVFPLQGHANPHTTLSDSGHAAYASGGHRAVVTELVEPMKIARRGQHERGISNKTPVSGYMSRPTHDSSASDCQAQGNLDITRDNKRQSVASLVDLARSPLGASQTSLLADYDRRIEEAVNSHFAPSDFSDSRYASTHLSRQPSAADHASKRNSLQARLPRSPQAIHTGEDACVPDISQQRRVASYASPPSNTKYSRATEVQELSQRPENRFCADCHRTNPRWASWALNGKPCCIFLCIDCSGIHRSMGVQVSKVKSVDLDDWSEEQLQSARDWGNARANACYEATKPSNITAASMGRDAPSHRQFWVHKYVEKLWFEPQTFEKITERRRSDTADAGRAASWAYQTPEKPSQSYKSDSDTDEDEDGKEDKGYRKRVETGSPMPLRRSTAAWHRPLSQSSKEAGGALHNTEHSAYAISVAKDGRGPTNGSAGASGNTANGRPPLRTLAPTSANDSSDAFT